MFKRTTGEKIFSVFNVCMLCMITLLCVVPLINIVALSFSSAQVVAGKPLIFWPVGFTFQSYEYILDKPEFVTAFFVSVKRLLIGLPINMIIIVLLAYPLSKDNKAFPGRTVIVWIFIFSMLFNGGLIPTFMTVKMVGLLDTIWALILPGTVPAFLIVLMLNFFRTIPQQLEESAMIDGASHWRILLQIYLPISTPGLATVALLAGVGHWNAWFDGLIYMNKAFHYPLQTYLQGIINQGLLMNVRDPEAAISLMSMNSRTLQSSQILVAIMPVLIVYPFVQRFFIKGIVLGSVKG